MIDVLCVGHAAWDINMRVADFPPEDGKVEAISLTESGGGPAANAVYLLSKWGVRCGFAGLVGDDEAGRRILREFRDIGADTTGMELRAGHSTPVSVILVSQRTGSRTIVTHKPAHTSFALPLFKDANPKVLLFDGHELAAAQAAMAQFPHAKTILDAGSLREGTAALASRVDHLVASEKFACQVSGLAGLASPSDWPTATASLHRLNGRPVVITLGERGLIHGTATNYEHIPAIEAKAVDTTAAGDIFHGAFAYGILMDLPWRNILQMASMTAALSVTSPGGRSSIPDLKLVQEALAHVG